MTSVSTIIMRGPLGCFYDECGGKARFDLPVERLLPLLFSLDGALQHVGGFELEVELPLVPRLEAVVVGVQLLVHLLIHGLALFEHPGLGRVDRSRQHILEGGPVDVGLRDC